MILTLTLLACIAPQGGVRKPPGSGGGDTDVNTTEGTQGTEPHSVDLVEVSHDRELRAAWVATVANINFPSGQGKSVATLQGELDDLVQTASDAHLNALFFQVRPEGDALYETDLEPWSRYLTGTQGGDPGFDPLAYLVEAAHEKNIEVHGWFNPYRAKSSASSAAVSPHIAVEHPEAMRTYGSLLWMDPGEEVVFDRTLEVVLDVARRTGVDGVHFDDYFYPYPNGNDFPDSGPWDEYVESGGTMSRGDWRRDNVNRLVEAVGKGLANEDLPVRFGIGPFGIYKNGVPAGITGLDQYEDIYADPLKWADEGWVDYLAPQLYWPSTQTAQAYGTLVNWWADELEGKAWLFPGNYLSKLGSSSSWDVDEFRTQVDLAAAEREKGTLGAVGDQIAPLQANTSGIVDVFADEFYPLPASTPPLRRARVSADPPVVEGHDDEFTLMHTDPVALRSYGLYHKVDGAFVLDKLLPESTATVVLEPGEWAISAITREGVESLGVRIVVP